MPSLNAPDNPAGPGYIRTTELYDALGRHRETHTYRVVDGTWQEVVTDKVAYDKGGRLAKRYEAHLAGSTPSDDQATRYDYRLNGNTGNWIDPLGRLWQVTTPNNTTRRTEYHGTVRKSFDEEGLETRETLDPFGRVAREEVWTGGASAYGGAIGGVSAPIGALLLQPALGSVISVIPGVSAQTAGDVATGALITAGLGQAAYGISQGDYSGIIGLGVSVGVSYMLFAQQPAQGANGPSRGPSFSRGGGQSRVLFWDEAEALYQNVSEVPPGGWETVVVDNSTAPSGAPRAYPGRIGLGGDFSMTAIPHPSDRFSTLVHEAWHVVQFGRGDWVRLGAASDWTKSWFGVDPYNPQLNRAGFGSYGIENQATLVEWNYGVTYNLGAPWNSPSNFPTTPSQVLRLRGLVP